MEKAQYRIIIAAMSEPPANSKIITNIQVLRALAALGVVLFHTRYRLPGDISTEFHGVPVFFVISGFIISRVGYKSASDFFLNRFLRIVPIYWVATLAATSWFRQPHELRGVALAVALAAVAAPPGKIAELISRRSAASRAAQFTATTLGVIAIDFFYRAIHRMSPEALSVFWRSFLFLPFKHADGTFYPTLMVGWSLNMEMFFYAVFGAFLFVNRRAAVLLTGLSLLTLRWLNTKGLITGPYAGFYGQKNVKYFIYGMILYYLFVACEKIPQDWMLSRSTRAGSALIVFGTTILYFLAILRPHLVSFPLSPVFLVAAALLAHLTGFRAKAPTLLLLGDASYSIYLFHTFGVETFIDFAPSLPWLATTKLLGMIVTVVVSTLIAVELHRSIERPLVAQCRGLLDRIRAPLTVRGTVAPKY